MERVRLGIVGLGWVAQVVHLPILLKMREAEIIAVCDRDRGRARLVAEKFGIMRVYTDHTQMLEQEDLDAVIVATSTDAHKEVALDSMKAGKDVLVEKPMAASLAEADELVDLARRSGAVLAVGHTQ